jgi:flagellar basal body-associated protein FliL
MRRILTPLRTLLACAILIAPGQALASSKGKEEKAAPVSYFSLQPLTAIAVRRDGRRGVLTVEAGIHSEDPKLMERAQQSTPRLRAAFAQVLMSYAASMRRGDPPDIDYLGREMQKSADKVLGKSGTRVLLGSALLN